MSQKWTDVLREPLNSDPQVVIVMAPKGASSEIRETLDQKLIVGFMVVRGKDGEIRRALQVLHPQISSWDENREVLTQKGMKPAVVRYRGPLSQIPDKCLLGDAMPLVFLENAAFLSYFNLKEEVIKAKGNDWSFTPSVDRTERDELRN